MQRDRNYNICNKLLRMLQYNFGQSICKPIGQRIHFLKFEQHDCTNECIFVMRKAARPVEMKSVVTASATKRQCADTDYSLRLRDGWRIKWQPAFAADRVSDAGK